MVESKDKDGLLEKKSSNKKFTRRNFLKGMVGALVTGVVGSGCKDPELERKEQYYARIEAMREAEAAAEEARKKRATVVDKTCQARDKAIKESISEMQEGNYTTTNEVRDLEKAVNAVWQERFPGSPEIKITAGVMTRYMVTAKEGVPLRDLPIIQGKQIGDLFPGYETPVVRHVVFFGSGEKEQSWAIFSIDSLRQDGVVRPGKDGIVEFGNTKIGFANLSGMEPVATDAP